MIDFADWKTWLVILMSVVAFIGWQIYNQDKQSSEVLEQAFRDDYVVFTVFTTDFEEAVQEIDKVVEYKFVIDDKILVGKYILDLKNKNIIELILGSAKRELVLTGMSLKEIEEQLEKSVFLKDYDIVDSQFYWIIRIKKVNTGSEE